MTNIEGKRLEFLKWWVNDALQYGDIKFEISINDDSDNERTAFEVKLSNEKNKNYCISILQVSDEGDSHYVEILWGDDFESCDHETFLRLIFTDLFLYPL